MSFKCLEVKGTLHQKGHSSKRFLAWPFLFFTFPFFIKYLSKAFGCTKTFVYSCRLHRSKGCPSSTCCTSDSPVSSHCLVAFLPSWWIPNHYSQSISIHLQPLCRSLQSRACSSGAPRMIQECFFCPFHSKCSHWWQLRWQMPGSGQRYIRESYWQPIYFDISHISIADFGDNSGICRAFWNKLI